MKKLHECLYGTMTVQERYEKMVKIINDYVIDKEEITKTRRKPSIVRINMIKEHIDFLRYTLIPDLKESGQERLIKDLETCIKDIRYLKDIVLGE